MPSVTIIGAGPSGSIAALLLSRAGWRVCLVEQHRFPRHKVCGECLSHLGHQVMSRHGLAGDFHRAGAVPLTRTLLYSRSGTAAELRLPQPMWGLSRWELDKLLLDAAVAAGTELLQPYRCESIRGSECEIRDLVTNQTTVLASDWILLADGRRSLGGPRPRGTGELGIKAHFEDVRSPRDAIELFSVAGHYLGAAPVEGSGRWNVAYAVPARRVKACGGDLNKLFARLLGENPALARAFSGARRATDWLASPLPRFALSGNWPRHLLPTGNAASSIEPIGGEGMGLALRSSELTAEALVEAGTNPEHVAIRQLSVTLRDLWSTRRIACRTAAMMMSFRPTSALVAGMLNLVPSLAVPPLHLLGKRRDVTPP